MALYRPEDQGESIRDIQDRLSALGFSTEPDPPGHFGPGTEAAVRSFQRARHLAEDGLIGRETWRTLVDAGFSLGERQLYYRMPMLHGDDVAELQACLDALGFDPGDIDGIFGSDTLRALLDFQQNRRMPEDGIAGPAVVTELRLMQRETSKMGRHLIKERVWLASLPTGLAGATVLVDPFCRNDAEAVDAWRAAIGAERRLRELGAHPILSRSSDTRPAERLRALHANERAANLVIAFAHPGTDEAGVYSFASAISKSEAAEAIASAVAGHLGVPQLGRVMPILRETRAAAIVTALPALDAQLGTRVVSRIEVWLLEEHESRNHSPSRPR